MSWLLVIVGGVLIGSASTLMLLLLGRITGISGILSAAIFSGSERFANENLWRWFFLLGMLVGPILLHYVLKFPIPETAPVAWWMAILPGLIVGLGVGIGSGCTSGHGICGISRLSPRSIVATFMFMGLGIVTVTIMRGLL